MRKRLRPMSVLIGGLCWAALPHSAQATERTPTQFQSNPVLSAAAPEAGQRPAKPFSNLFKPSGTPPVVSPLSAPTVVFGLTLVPVDPALDSGIRRQAPLTPTPRIRSVQPSRCKN